MFGVEFAPLTVPWERRLQTLHVIHFIFVWMTGVFFAFPLLIYLLFTELRIISLIYFGWVIYDIFIKDPSSNGGRRWEMMRNFSTWRYLKDYFPIELVKTSDLDPKKNYVFAYHPHGVLAFGAFVNFGTEATDFKNLFPGIKPHIAAMKFIYRLPVFREYLLAFGGIDCSERSIDHVLSKDTGNAVMIIPGGAIEALDATASEEVRLTLKDRRGFVRKAIENGASLVPIFGFGENQPYKLIKSEPGTIVRKVQLWLQTRLQISTPIVKGRGVFQYSFGLLPHRKRIISVVGKPIDVPHVKNPPRELIQEYHEKYCEELQNLFEKYKVILETEEQKLILYSAREARNLSK